MPSFLKCPRCGREWPAPEARGPEPRAPRDTVCPGCGLHIPASPAPSTPSPPPPLAPRTLPPPPGSRFEPPPGATADNVGNLDGDGEGGGPLLARKTREPEDLVDLTSMVDVVFFLLMFFLVTSAQALQAVINVPTPDPEDEKAAPTVVQSESDDEFVVVKIDRDDTIWLDEAVIPSQQELIERLRDVRESGGESLGIMVLGNEECSHEAVVKVVDAGAEAGMTKIRLGIDNSLDE